MPFYQRVASTLLHMYYYSLRDYYWINPYEELLDKLFPDDPRPRRPSLNEMEKNVALTFQFGHPQIMDGLRPLSPNFIHVSPIISTYMVKTLEDKTIAHLGLSLLRFIPGQLWPTEIEILKLCGRRRSEAELCILWHIGIKDSDRQKNPLFCRLA